MALVYELWEVSGDAEAAKAKVQRQTRKDSVIVTADELSQLAHPVHLAEAQEKFGHVKPAGADDEPEVDNS